MLPLLRLLSDGKEWTNADIYKELLSILALSEEDAQQLLPSGKMPIFVNRVAWAKTHLKQAGLVSSVRRGVYKVTDLGRSVLKDHPQKIDIRFLMQFPDFCRFRSRKAEKGENPDVAAETGNGLYSKTPEELIESGVNAITEAVENAVLESVRKASPYFFEKVVLDLLLAMGYGGSRQDAGRLTARTGDAGIDGVINEDKLGLDVIYIQAKKWDGCVGRPEVQKFAGALQGQRATKGVFITTSYFSKDAQDFAGSIQSKIILIDGERLARLMVEYGVGVSVVQTFHVKKIDSDYFSED